MDSEQRELSSDEHCPEEENKVLRLIDEPYGPIEIIAVKRENSAALSDLHHTIADIMIKQAEKKAAQD
ncbi:hypothetical protein DFP94_10994 [Fontibacillus phaseoli]|uniref:Uncharacterized protein n=1 Tax=Fontibacillus phaseoli TaxID=1416533 RepID=A0A369B775_9BACL|nr:hypothetical protein [Fontibacillus phaseoli]RCX17370.1 hypothetical protein DFP94_10994 [Fontibacillus phaseoli]